MHEIIKKSLVITLALGTSTACASNASSPASVKTSYSTNAPAFVRASSDLGTTVALYKQGKVAEAESILNKITGNPLCSPENKQLAFYLLASIKAKNSSKETAINSYKGAFGHPMLGNLARLKAHSLAKSLNDESLIQALLVPAFQGIQASPPMTSEKINPDLKFIRETNAELCYRLGESYYRSKKYASAAKVFVGTRSAFPGTIYATGSAYYLGSIAIEHDKDTVTGLKYFREYLTKSANGKHSPKIVKKLRSLSTPSGTNNVSGEKPTTPIRIKLSSQDHNLMAYACYKHTLWKMALTEWSKANYRHILRPICMARLKKREQAINEFISVVKLDPTNPLIINAATELSKALTKAQARLLWTKLLALNIKHKDVIIWNIAKRSSGVTYYSKLAFGYPNSKHSDDAMWWLIWHHTKASYHSKGKNKKAHLTKAAKLCVTGVQRYPNSALAPMYGFWSGKIHERMGMKKEAITIYNTTFDKYPNYYYGYRSHHRAIHLASVLKNKGKKNKKIIPDRGWKIHPGRKLPISSWQWPGPPKYFSWRKLAKSIGQAPTLLAWLGQYPDALDFVSSKTPRHLRGWLYVQDGKQLRGLGISAYKIKGKPEKSLFWQFNYPLPYPKIVDREARKHGVEPLLAYGLMRQESKFQPSATSRSNAMGLMQLLKGTAYGVAKHNGIKLANTKQIYNPETNIKLGCAYLGYVLRGKNGNAMQAVGSYNGGPNAMKRWVRKHRATGIHDWDYFVENIPYRETRGYIRKVFGNYWNYETIYLKNRATKRQP